MKFEKISNKTLRDEFAEAAMAGWLASFGPDSTHPAACKHNPNACFEVAEASYMMADAMLVAREEQQELLNQAPGPADIDRYFYIGGPWHGKYLLGENAPYVVCEPGQYHRHSLEINGKGGKAVYVWSESSYEEAVDLVLGCMK